MSAETPQQLSRSPSKWLEELEASPSLLTLASSSAIISKGLSLATSPILQKRLYQTVKSHVPEMVACAPGCDILASLLRFGTIKTAANVIKCIVETATFKTLTASSSSASTASDASPKKTTAAANKKKALAAASSSSTTSTSSSSVIDLQVVNNFAPIINATAYRVDVDPERNMILEPALGFVIAAINQQLSSALIIPAEGGVTEIALGLIGEKGGALGDKFVDALVANQPFVDHLLNNQRDKSVTTIVSKLVAAATESMNLAPSQQSSKEESNGNNNKRTDRASKFAGSLWTATKKAFAQDLTSIRISFMIALAPHRKDSPVINELATFVAKQRTDVFSICLTSTAPKKSELVTVLLNLAGGAAAKALAQVVVTSVEDWTDLFSKAQLPQVVLGCFMALRQVVHNHPELISSKNSEEMTNVLDSATRHFLKQTLSAAESAKLAVKLRLSNSSSSAGETTEKPKKLLKVVDSDDEGDDTTSKTTTNKVSGTRRPRDEDKSPRKASPKNSAAKKAAVKK